MEEVNNIYPSITKSFISSKNRNSVSGIRRIADIICRGAINPDYIHNAFNKFKKGIVYYREGICVAFCIWKIRTHIYPKGNVIKELHIYLVCAKKSDFSFLGLIMNDVEAECLLHGINMITLYPANNDLKDYYIKHGFIMNGGIIDDTIMVKKLNIFSIKKTNKTRKFHSKKFSHIIENE
jgi:hypothetical protein